MVANEKSLAQIDWFLLIFSHSYLPVFASCLPHISVAAAKLI